MTRSWRSRAIAVTSVVTTLLLSTLGPVSATDASTATSRAGHPTPAGHAVVVRYQMPVAAEVVKPFDGPTGRFGAGHRGVDLAAEPGDVVRSAADGRITHAGPVAGATWVTVAHEDGVVTSYGPIAALRVRSGVAVHRGTRLGVVASGGHGLDGRDTGLHFGARIAGLYVDPLSLVDEGVARPSLIGAGGWAGTDHAVMPYEPWDGNEGGWTTTPSPAAQRPGFAVPPSPNHLVLIAGLASSSNTRLIDADHLGYDPESVTRFSYAGRTGARGAADDPHRDQRPYEPRDTWAGIDDGALRLRDQLRAQAAREPGRAVDLVGHSMGGVVILRYLTAYHDPYDLTLPPVGNVVTVAAPLQGSDLAELGTGLLADGLVDAVVEGGRGLIAEGFGGRAAALSFDAPAIDQMRPTSKQTRGLADAWEHALHDGTAGVLATGTRVLTIGGSRDLVVGAHRTALPRDQLVAWQRVRDDASRLDGHPDPSGDPRVPALPSSEDLPDLEHRILPGGHHGVLESEAVREVMWRFMAGQDVVEARRTVATAAGEDLGSAMSLAGLALRARALLWAPVRHILRPPPTVP